MKSYKKSIYVASEKINENTYLCYSSLSNEFILLTDKTYSIFSLDNIEEMQFKNPSLFQLLLDKRFIIPSDLNETDEVTLKRKNAIFNKDWYNVVINTTLDCNVNCWYCYEKKIKGSRLSEEVINQITRNIEIHYLHHPYELLKIAFFGGEPFMNWKGMRSIIEFAYNFCKERNLELILDFTTNATLITKEIVEYLSPFRCHFQITLDGEEKTHNSIKFTSDKEFNSYRKTLEALQMIEANINNRLIALRINFDNRALNEIDKIIRDISFLDRKKCYVIVKKVWQVKRETVDKEALLNVIQKLLDHDFLPDYYVMPKGGVCFAERENQVLFNYDGNVFKCTTIPSFDKENTLGEWNKSTGLVEWKQDKIEDWFRDIQQPQCLICKWYGACLGPCNRQLLANRGKFICTFDAMNLSDKEYLMYLFKYNLLLNKLSNKQE